MRITFYFVFIHQFFNYIKKLKTKTKEKEYLPGYMGVLLPQASSFGEGSML